MHAQRYHTEVGAGVPRDFGGRYSQGSIEAADFNSLPVALFNPDSNHSNPMRPEVS